MRWATFIALLALFVLPASFAAIIQSGDNGGEFVEKTAQAQCGAQDVQAVYKCLGNVVRVVSSVPGEGSTFYKPEGKAVYCPVVAPSEMGAECLQMMTPNFCPIQAECGLSPAPEIFPGQNDTPEQTGDEDAYIVPGQAASDNVQDDAAEAEPEPEKPAAPPKRTTIIKDNEVEAAGPVQNDVDAPFGYLVLVVLLLGIGAVGVLFLLFRNSLAEDEA